MPQRDSKQSLWRVTTPSVLYPSLRLLEPMASYNMHITTAKAISALETPACPSGIWIHILGDSRLRGVCVHVSARSCDNIGHQKSGRGPGVAPGSTRLAKRARWRIKNFSMTHTLMFLDTGLCEFAQLQFNVFQHTMQQALILLSTCPAISLFWIACPISVPMPDCWTTSSTPSFRSSSPASLTTALSMCKQSVQIVHNRWNRGKSCFFRF